MPTYALAGMAAFVVLTIAVLVIGRSGRMARGRVSRLARVGRLSAQLWASWLGATIRRRFAGRERRAQLDSAQRAANARRITSTMGEMKGVLMKLGQMISFVSDGVPAEYRAAMESLQASAPPMSFPLIRDVAERELGKPLERAFARFDGEPLASASIGQVHRAQLGSGEVVAVKIQYPGVAEALRADLANASVLYRMAAVMYPALDPKPIVEELRTRFVEELDYKREAANQRGFRARFTGCRHVHIPALYDGYCTERVLISEFVPGRKFADILGEPAAVRDRYAEIIYRFVFQSIIEHGAFNGDPHPGNYIFDVDGELVTFLDFGCVKYFPAPMMAAWRQLVMSHLEGRKDDFRELLIQLGFITGECKLETDLLYDYFRYFYEPFAEDRVFTFTPEYNAQSLKMVFSPEKQFAGLTKQINMPPDFAFVNRIQWGIYSMLSKLGATGNWHRIHREYLYGDPPSTELGKAFPSRGAGASESGQAPAATCEARTPHRAALP